jgi:hypothetical protein
MIKLTLTASLPLAILLLCGSPSPIEAQGSSPITVKDGGSVLLIAGGLDAGTAWNVTNWLQHKNAAGVLSSLKITEAGADRCAGSATCGVDPSKHWTIQVNYAAASVTIASVSANKGVRVKFSRAIPFAKWQKTANADERAFGHGDGLHITGIAVNNGPNLCPGKDGCEVDLVYTFPAQ